MPSTSRGFVVKFTERSQNNYCRLPHTNYMQPAGGFTQIWLKRRASRPPVVTREHRNQDKIASSIKNNKHLNN